MRVIVGSRNPSKKEAIELALKNIGVNNYEIIGVSVESHVSSKPLNKDIIKGARNRNKELKKYCEAKSINYDLLISIEGGFQKIENEYFLITYAIIYDKNTDKEIVGSSPSIWITENMYEWCKSGRSLNRVIQEILESKDNKKQSGISGYLSNNYYYRSVFDSSAVTSAMQTVLNQERYKKLEDKISKNVINKSLIKNACSFASIKHFYQKRKNGIQYITHPIAVAGYVEKYIPYHPMLSELIAAAYLHDTVEDTNTTINEIRGEFGEYIAYLVELLTNDEDEIEKVGKTVYLCKKLAAMPDDALYIKLCDRLDNINDLYGNIKEDFKQRYIKETVSIIAYLEKNRELNDIHKTIIDDIKSEVINLQEKTYKKC